MDEKQITVTFIMIFLLLIAGISILIYSRLLVGETVFLITLPIIGLIINSIKLIYLK